MLGSVSNNYCCHAGQVVTIEITCIQYCTVQGLNQQTISAMCSFIKVLTYMNKTLSGHL